MHEFGDIAEKHGADISGTFAVHSKEKSDIGVIWLDSNAKPHVVAHEAFHAACWMLGESGVWLTNSSEEAYAYCLAWLIKQI